MELETAKSRILICNFLMGASTSWFLPRTRGTGAQLWRGFGRTPRAFVVPGFPPAQPPGLPAECFFFAPLNPVAASSWFFTANIMESIVAHVPVLAFLGKGVLPWRSVGTPKEHPRNQGALSRLSQTLCSGSVWGFLLLRVEGWAKAGEMGVGSRAYGRNHPILPTALLLRSAVLRYRVGGHCGCCGTS